MATEVQEHAPQILNRRARYEYNILEKLEVGLVLAGTEVKSVRDGQAQLSDAFARIDGDEVWLHGCHIAPYLPAATMNGEPKRPRKLLMHRREIRRLGDRMAERGGATLIPLKIYWRRGFAKVELALATAKTKGDKRENIKERESDREIRREYAKH